MLSSKYKPEKLVESIRDGLVDEEHLGFVVSDFDYNIGDSKDYPFYLRSCAKPLQASLLIDYGMDKEFCMKAEEIALCSASHAGEDVHITVAKGLLAKLGLHSNALKCGFHKPLSKSQQEKMLFREEKETTLHNNCSGKHIMMLGLCKLKGWNISNYNSPTHPLQVAIKKKIYELCELTKEYPMTTDGCGVPIVSMPLKNLVKGYTNLFSDEKYAKLKDAFLNNPYIIGGEDRTDTKIIEDTGLIAKVGAGGLIVVYNPKLKKSFVVKISDCNMQARELVACEIINKLEWGNIGVETDVTTHTGLKVGKLITHI